jgi:threonine dehydratase
MAVAWAARTLGVAAAVFVPTTCPAVKLRRLSDYGATVTVIGDAYDDSLIRAQAYAEETGALFVHAFDHPATVAGAGTVAAEFVEQVPELDRVMVAVGGGGLLAGTLIALAGTPTQVVGVEPSTAQTLGAALDAGTLVDVDVDLSGAAVDSLAPRRAGRIAFEVARTLPLHLTDVADSAIRQAQLTAWAELRIGLEGGGATALAALLSGAYQPEAGEVVGVICSGGNADIARIAEPSPAR